MSGVATLRGRSQEAAEGSARGRTPTSPRPAAGDNTIRALETLDRLRLTYASVAARPGVQFWAPVAALAGLALPFYWLSAVPYVNGGDRGEFQTLGYLGGIPHPPTYPLLMILLFAGSHALGFLEPAHAASIVNATLAALATVLLFIVARDVTQSWVAAITAAVVFATGFRIWALAVEAWPFSLQTVLVLSVVVALRAFQRQPTAARTAAVAFVTGLSLTNHGLSLFMLPFTAAYVLFRLPLRRPRLHEAAMSVGAFVLGLTPWAYLLRALWTPVVLNRPEAPTLLSFPEIWEQVGARTAAPGGVSLIDSILENAGTLPAGWHELNTDLQREYGWIWIALLIAGAFLVTARDWRLAVWTLGTVAVTSWFTFRLVGSYQIVNYARYYSVIYVILGIWLAGGLALVLVVAREAFARLDLNRHIRPAMYALSVFMLVAAGLRVQVQMTGDPGENINDLWKHSKSHHTHARLQLEHMVPDSVYMTNWTSSWHHRYALFVDGIGADKNLEVRLTAYETMGIDQAEGILQSGRGLYLQRTTPEYERDFAVVQEGAFYQVFLPVAVRDGDLIKGSDDRVYLIAGGERRWIPSLEIFEAHGFVWDHLRLLEDRDIVRLPEGLPLEMPQPSGERSSKTPCPPTCVTAN